ncbi:MAG: restriction endonuclease subunit S [Chloroflexi bacterium]|nr:restriction endonuclease subunit S [Chloroflexota bacterium]MCL5074870.1 restriction endonuclease subunit S [Chloroflexota bacterium]
MSGEWHTASIGEVAEKVAMGPFGSSIKVETFVSEGVPVISGQHLHDSRLDETPGFNFITPEHADRLKNANVQRGDVVFTHAGNIGQVSYIPWNSRYERYVISQRQFYMRCNPQHVIPQFVVYYFKTAEGQHKLLANAAQVGVPSIAQPVTYLKTIKIPLPPLPEQRAIAAILGALDDKIELNRRMNETLEAMAGALFKSWFVGLEPFRDQGMQDSLVGPIPKGWRCATVAEAVGINPPRRLERGANAVYVDMSALPTASARVLETIRRPFSGSGSRFANGDVLLARITPCLENGKTAVVDFLQDGEIGWGSTEFIVLGPKPPLGMPFNYCLARHPDFRAHAIQAMTGTSGRQRVDPGCFDHYWVAVPLPSIAERFEQQVKPWFQKMKANDDESQALGAIRASLLPKLLSGEIRVKDAEKFVEAIA